MRALINAGADIYAADENGFTALHLAAMHGHVEAMEVLM